MPRSYTPQQVARLRRLGEMTPNGVVFDYALVSIDGARFTLIREAHHDDDSIRIATRHIRNDRDVVGPIQIATVQAS